MKLEDFAPEYGVFKLRAFPGKEFHLRPVSLVDEAWLQKTFPDIEAVFKEMRMQEIYRIVFRLLPYEEQVLFKTQTVKFISEDGTETTEEIGGAKLLAKAICGAPEKMAIFEALLKTIGASRFVEEVTVNGEAVEKKRPRPTKGPTKKK